MVPAIPAKAIFLLLDTIDQTCILVHCHNLTFPSLYRLSGHAVQSAKAPLLEKLHLKARVPAQRIDFISSVHMNITVALKIDERDLYVIAEPPDSRTIHRHVAQDQSSARLQHSVNAVRKEDSRSHPQ